MEAEIDTSRLKLVRLLVAAEGHRDLQWYHRVWSNEQATKWSRSGPKKTIAQSKIWMAGVVPSPGVENSKTRIAYAVLVPRPMDPNRPTTMDDENATDPTGDSLEDDWDVTGIITLLPESPPQSETARSTCSSAKQNLTLELGYLFLPSHWGLGYATESTRALLDEFKRSISCASPAAAVELVARVHVDNLPSIRVVEKLGFQEVTRSEDEELVSLDGKERRNIAVHFKKAIQFRLTSDFCRHDEPVPIESIASRQV
ncbi:hypothetical protein CC80DRAFT_597501 [Byssothecium circinans]|uniref:N-acetyltransferase domain-containing protein n=1 Tax=Byssothecium circinans TaxID=147558 RepID=A0A6A5TKI1_9PLEO|nr:hypothetical protein CC80DRAFT_597501 [Byssothecium circinans]